MCRPRASRWRRAGAQSHPAHQTRSCSERGGKARRSQTRGQARCRTPSPRACHAMCICHANLLPSKPVRMGSFWTLQLGARCVLWEGGSGAGRGEGGRSCLLRAMRWRRAGVHTPCPPRIVRCPTLIVEDQALGVGAGIAPQPPVVCVHAAAVVAHTRLSDAAAGGRRRGEQC